MFISLSIQYCNLDSLQKSEGQINLRIFFHIIENTKSPKSAVIGTSAFFFLKKVPTHRLTGSHASNPDKINDLILQVFTHRHNIQQNS